METVRLASPHLLAILVPAWGLILYVALRPYGPHGRKHPGGSGRRPGARVRAALACLATGFVILALAGPSLRVSRLGAATVIIAEDISPSMKMANRSGPTAWLLTPYAAAVPPKNVGLVRFSGQAATAAAPRTPAAERLARADAWPPETAVQAEAETDIAAALEQAGAAIPNGRGLVLLYSDGRETRGDALRAATSLAACGIQVHAVLPTFAPRDVGILSIAAPAEAPLGRPIQIEIRLAATVPLAATVRLERRRSDPYGSGLNKDGPQEPPRRWDRSVQVDAAADATLLFEDSPPAAGVYEYRAEVASSADDWPENDRAACLVRVGEARQVIYIYGGSGPSGLPAILERSLPPAVTVQPAPAASLRLPGVGGVTLILDNVSAWALGKDRTEALARRVTGGGLGLLVLGGDEAFAAGGYGDSPLEDLLPVTSRTGMRQPLDMVLVIDSSGSMNESVGGRSKLTLAKQAVLALRPALGEGDRIGIVAFAGEPPVASPLVPLSEWATLEQRVVEMVAGGGTRITPAVEAAVGLFLPPGAEPTPERHILLLSDGRSEDFDVPRLIAACKRAGVSVSTVATGQDVDLPRLALLARGTGGRVHDVRDLARLSETFLHEMTWARGDGLRTGTRPATWRQAEPIWRTAGGALPPVDAYNETFDKPGADIQWRALMLPNEPPSLVTPPLLATWQRGLGRVAAMPWPVSQAGEAWTVGERIGKDLAAVIEWLYTSPAPADWSARLIERDGSWWVRVEERAERIGKSSSPLVATVFGAGGFKEERRSLEAVGPGIWEARIGPRGGPAAMVVVRREDHTAAQTVSVPEAPPREFERFGVDRAALEQIVQAGGGMIHTDPETLAEVVRNFEARDFLPVGVYLVWAAVAVIAIQAGLRLAGRL